MRKTGSSKPTFRNLAVKIKYIIQESAILTLFVALTVFAIFRGQAFRQTKFYSFLEWLVIISVCVVIVAEIITLLTMILATIRSFREDSKKRYQDKDIDAKEKESGQFIEERDQRLKKMETFNKSLQKFSARKSHNYDELQRSNLDQKKSNEDQAKVLQKMDPHRQSGVIEGSVELNSSRNVNAEDMPQQDQGSNSRSLRDVHQARDPARFSAENADEL